jgi:hypothetical protein
MEIKTAYMPVITLGWPKLEDVHANRVHAKTHGSPIQFFVTPYFTLIAVIADTVNCTRYDFQLVYD